MITWKNQAILLHIQKYKETSILATAFCQKKGLERGIIKTKKLIMAGNICELSWQARLEEHLGTFKLEDDILTTSAFILHIPPLLNLMNSALTLLSFLIAEKDPHPHLFEQTKNLFLSLTEEKDLKEHFKLYFLWEKILLSEIGFSLDLTQCAATHTTDNLIYISPKTGRAVCQKAGKPYHDKLLPLPPFFLTQAPLTPPLTYHDLDNAYQTLGHFFYNPLVHHDALTQQKLKKTRAIVKKYMDKHFTL